ncbi:hypothetical protein BX592_11467 [Paraburkholderia rhizosphaerae]|uniref:Uncharacterized protein n=1 Tax=Paraburkholderia rhizosphaerae TaxID=480658 RepID=A0A4R8LP19_9BURK|nr:hypothetical protein BX592_11467 [Paraburkholderia rhizosphaerae]
MPRLEPIDDHCRHLAFASEATVFVGQNINALMVRSKLHSETVHQMCIFPASGNAENNGFVAPGERSDIVMRFRCWLKNLDKPLISDGCCPKTCL